MRGIYMIFEFTLKVKLTGVAVIVLELSSYVKFTVEKKCVGGCQFVVRYILYLFTFVPHSCKDTFSLG